MALINLKKTLTDEALAAMSRNTMVDGGAINTDVMQRFNQEMKTRLDKIPNAVLKTAIEQSIRENTTNTLMKATVSQVPKIVEDAFDAITEQLGIKKAPPPPPPPPPPKRSTWGGK